MIVSALITDIRNDIQDDTAFSDSQLLSLVNEGLRDFCRYTEIRQEDETVVVSALESLVSIPADFVNFRAVRWSYNRQLIARNERKMDYDSSDWKFEVGTPEQYAFFNYNAIRVKPITSAAGTVLFRTTTVPDNLTLTDSIPLVTAYETTLRWFVDAMCFLIVRDYDKAGEKWKLYLKEREAALAQAHTPTPDIFKSQRPVNVFNYPMWDSRYRSWR